MLFRYVGDAPWSNTGPGPRTLCPAAGAGDMTNRDVIAMQTITAQLGEAVNLGVIETWEGELRKLKGQTKDETRRLRREDRRAQILGTIVLFASFRKAGYVMTFDDALDITQSQTEVIIEAGDDEDLTDAVGPTKRPEPAPASGRPAAKAAAAKRSGRKSATRKR